MTSYGVQAVRVLITDRPLIGRMAAAADNKAMRALLQPMCWQPDVVTRSSSGLPFSTATAWQYIAEVLRMHKYDLYQVTLKEPPNGIGFDFVSDFDVTRAVYVKFMFPGNGKILGRSFHCADYPSLI